MAVHQLQASFAKGELSPRLHARSDIEQWRLGLKECVNWFVMRQGGLRKRPGTRFVAEIKNSGQGARLIPFVFSVEQAYVLEFGETYARVFANGGRVMNGANQVEFTTPYTLAQAKEVHFAQSADVLYLAHKAVSQRKITRTSDTSWTQSSIAFTSPPTNWAAGNYPARVSFYQERLAWGRTNTRPQTIWLSKSTDLESHAVSTPLVDTDAISLTFLSGESEPIAWLAETDDLLIGTSSAARTIGPSSSSAFSATNVRQRRRSKYGGRDIQPVQVGDSVLYVNRYGVGIREFRYTVEEGVYGASEFSVLSEHMLRSGVVAWAYAQDPDSIVWCATGAGELVGITYERDQAMIAMHRHRLGGDAGKGYGEVESVAVIPAASRFEVWMIVKRVIAGQTRRFIEVLDPAFEGGALADAFFVDCGLTYKGAPASTVSGLNHLVGAEVAILADGAVMPNQTVAPNGAITLPEGRQASTIHVGLPYAARACTLPFAAQMSDGSTFGRRMRIKKVIVDVMETGGLRIGAKDDKLEELILRRGRDDMSRPLPLFTGAHKVTIEGSWADGGEAVFLSDRPQPATVRALNVAVEPEP